MPAHDQHGRRLEVIESSKKITQSLCVLFIPNKSAMPHTSLFLQFNSTIKANSADFLTKNTRNKLINSIFSSNIHSHRHKFINNSFSCRKLRSNMADLRQRSIASVQESRPDSTTSSAISNDNAPDSQKLPSISQRAISQTLQSTANLANLLPTGTLLAFQLLTPVFTNNGSCDTATRPMTFILLSILAVSCFLASFTDSFKASDGQVYYGFATLKGLWIFDYPTAAASGIPEDLSKYRLSFMDVVHAVVSVLVFVAIALKDKNVVSCFYPSPGHETQEVLDIVPIGIGLISSFLFVVFPTRRHSIGYPVTREK